MENSFWAIVGIRFTIKSVVEKTLVDAVSAVCGSNDYCFYGSRWFIDIKGNFKIFRFNGTSYIAKETSNEKADLEVNNSLKAKEKLDGKIINTKRIKVVVPQKITLPSSKERYFLVSEYLGSDMNDGEAQEFGMGEPIEVEGWVVPLEAISSLQWYKYDIKGVVQVDRISAN